MIKRPSWSINRSIALLGSSVFFRCIVGLLVVQAVWLALSGRYPMAFDEDFHLGVIRLYSHHLNPFWSAHPDGGDAFGAIARDPSYLYHYLLSFPYRLINVFTNNQALQVLLLRGINIALFATSLPLFRRLLLKTGASRALVHVCLLIFVLIPIVPLLAAQINYDNLILPLTATALLLAVRLEVSLSKKSLAVVTGLQLLILLMLSSLVKYAFLPLAVGIGLYIMLRIYQVYRRPDMFGRAIARSWSIVSYRSRIGLVIGLLIATGLFAERYGINIVRYHTPVPDCAQALDYDHCQYYGPWIRDYNFAQTKGDADRSPVSFTQHWLYGMWFRSFFAVDGPTTGFETRGPLTVPALSILGFIVIGFGALVVAGRRVWRHKNASVLWLLVIPGTVYVVVLWASEYQLFLQTGQPVAINGRYLLPILPGALVLAGLAVQQLLNTRKQLKLVLAIGLIVSLFYGGGALTYILRSSDSWYWPGTTLVTINHGLQRNLGPLVPGYDKPIQYLH